MGLQFKLRMGMASLVAVIVIAAVLVIFIAPQIDLDDIVIRAGQLFLGLLLAFTACRRYQGKYSSNAGDISPGIRMAHLQVLSPSLKVMNLLC